jgi:Transaldolase/Fructose-6-phosphate aldolase
VDRLPLARSAAHRRPASPDLRRRLRRDHNPTIIEQAVIGSDAYDDQIRALAAAGVDAEGALFELSATDVTAACDALADVWLQTAGRDGVVSWEVCGRVAGGHHLAAELTARGVRRR